MAERQIETDEKPCPLTRSDWMRFLAAESQVMHGYKHLAVTMLLMVGSITLTAYAATRFETFGFFLRLFSVTAFCTMFAVLMYYGKRTINIFKEIDENSEIIEEIISGELTNSAEIRERWEKHGTPANAEELLKICEKQIEIGWNVGKFFNLVVYSFRGNFKAIEGNIQLNILNGGEVKKFIAVCENRRERAKILLNEIAPLIGFVVVAMTVVATIIPKQDAESGYELLEGILSTPLYGGILIILFMGFMFLFVMLAHYRTQVHAWTAFEEGAIMQKPPAEE